MNGYAAKHHIGKPIRQILGDAAPRIEDTIRGVLKTGKPLYNIEFRLRLPTRKTFGHWLESYYPVKDRKGRVNHVVVLVVEMTARKKLENATRQLIDRLMQAELALRNEKRPSNADQLVRMAPIRELLEDCLSDAHRVAKLLRPPLLLAIPSITAHSEPVVCSPQTRESSADSLSERDSLLLQRLTEREKQTLRLLAEGKSTKEIGVAMGISARTVDEHRAQLLQKLAARSVGQLVRFAVRSKLVPA